MCAHCRGPAPRARGYRRADRGWCPPRPPIGVIPWLGQGRPIAANKAKRGPAAPGSRRLQAIALPSCRSERAHDQAGIGAAEAKAVVEHGLDGSFLGLVWHEIDALS